MFLMQCIFSSNAFPFFDKILGKIGMFSSNVNSTSFAKLLLNFPKNLISRKWKKKKKLWFDELIGIGFSDVICDIIH
jgi:hypothetical protein